MPENLVIRPHRRVFNTYTLVGLVYCLSFAGVFYFLSPNVFLTIVHGAAFLIFLCNYLFLARTGNFNSATIVFLATGLGVVTALFATGGLENTGYLWPLVYLVFVFFITERDTWPWVIALFSACGAVVLLNAFRVIHQPYSFVALVSFFSALSIITIFIYYFHLALARNSQEKTRLIVDWALDAIICIDSRSRITEWNPQAETTFGWTAEEAIGRSITETIIPETYRQRHEAGMSHYLRTGEGPALNRILELAALHRDGTVFPIELTIIPIGQNEDRFFCAFVRNITQRKKDEAQLLGLNATLEQKAEALATSNAELEHFAYLASHDLQEPLRTISGFIKLLNDRYRGKLDEKAERYLALIFESAERMKILIKDLLDYSRIGKNRQMSAVDGNLLLRHALADLGKTIQETGAKIEAEALPTLDGYATELQLLFQNLIANALKFRKKDLPPTIHIGAKRNDGYWEFSFRDNGIGIDEKNRDQIFIIFKKLHPRSAYDGSGIGLAHCKKIVEVHGGRIWMESEPGVGSTFYFTIPAR